MRTQPTAADTPTEVLNRTPVLDRTDVLPVLDVEAYEQTLVEHSKSLSRTDTWTVEALRDIDELIDSATHEAPVEVRSINGNKGAPAGEAFTVNVDRILKRIADLEADIVEAHDANAVLHKRNETLQIERDQHAARLATLTTESARLAEHRTLAEEMAQRTQQQLREELQRLETQLKQEKASSSELARRFAAKLSEHDRLLANVGQHARTIDELVEMRDDLDQRLRNEIGAGAELKAKLAASEEAMSANRALLLERESALAEAARRQNELNAEFAAQVRDVEGKRDALIAERDAAQAQVRALQMDSQASGQLAQERADEIVAMRGQLEGSAANARRLEDDIRATEQVIEGLRLQLQTAHDECAIMADQREKARARTKQLTQEVFRRDHKIDELEADLAVHSEALAAIRRDVSRIGEKEPPALVEEAEWVLEPIEHPGEPIRLTGSMLTIGRTAENDIALPSKMVSRHHARLLIGPTGIIVEDAGSTNGCFVNGEQVRQHLMHDNDVLELGDLRYRLQLRASRETAARANVVSLFEQSPE